LSVPEAKETGVHRGMVACAPGAFAAGDAVDVDLTLTKRSPRLGHREPIRFHVGTVEVRGQLLLLDRDAAAPGDAVVARVELDEDVCCAAGDRFLLRLQNPAMTCGGGKVIRLSKSGRYRRKDLGEELVGILVAGGAELYPLFASADAPGLGLTPSQLGLSLTPLSVGLLLGSVAFPFASHWSGPAGAFRASARRRG
jgi:hypothetical protein